MQFKGSGSVVWEWRMSPSYPWAKGGEPLFYRVNTDGTYVYFANQYIWHCKGSEQISYENGEDFVVSKAKLYDCDSEPFRLGVGPQAYYGVLGSYDQFAQTITASFTFTPIDPNPSTISLHPDQAGSATDNTNTKYEPEPPCSIGLPQYSVNTSFLNLVIEDTDFGCQSRGHEESLRRVWNMRPSIAGMFGNGWSFAYESTLLAQPYTSGGAALTLGSGQVVDYAVAQSASGGTGIIAVDYSRTTAGLGPILTASLSQATGIGTYTLTDKAAKITRVYNYVGERDGAHLYRLAAIADRNANTINLDYDSTGRLSALRDTSNRQTRFSYDANNRCTLMQTFDGRSASYQYDSAGNLAQSVDLAGNVIRYTYNAQNYPLTMTVAGRGTTFAYATKTTGEIHVAAVTEPNGKVRSYAFNSDGTTRVTEPGGGVTTYGNSNGRTASVRNPLNQTTTTTYNAQMLPTAITDALGRTTAFEYDANGNLTKVTDSAGKSSTFTYDSKWNLTSATNALGQTFNYAYDARDNRIGATTPLGRTTTYTVDGKGQITKITQPGGTILALSYDSHGNLTGITDPLGHTSGFTFDAQGLNLALATDALGHVTGYSFDANRRLTAVNRPDGTSVQYGYDCCSLTSVRDGAGNTTSVQRDAMLNVTAVTDPLGNLARFTYSDAGDRVSAVDPNGHTAQFSYDQAHRPASIVNAQGGIIAFGRDATGSLTTLADERGKVTNQTYDNRGLLATLRDPLGRTTAAFTRDALGRVSGVTNARGGITAWTYDADGRINGKKHNGNAVATYAWNLTSNLTAVSDAVGTKTFTYDAAERVTAIGYPDGRTTAISYDAAGNVAAMTYGDGLAVSYTYDARNRVTGVSFAGNTLTRAYDAADHLVGETRSNGVASTYAYDAAGRLTRIAHSKGATVIADLTYARDASGLITQESGTWPLAPVNAPSTDTATYDDANELVNRGTANATHDADGNLTALSDARSFSATYDPENRPTSITRNGSTTTYVYDGLGQRVQVQSDPITRRFYYDTAGRLLFDRDVTNSVTTHYIYAGGRLVASGSNAAGYVFYHFDKTGSTLALTNNGGSVAAAFAYDPYGKVVARSGSVSTPFTYVGAYGVIEGAGDLFFMQNRYYDAVTGRFIQRDPIGFAGGQSNLVCVCGEQSCGTD